MHSPEAELKERKKRHRRLGCLTNLLFGLIMAYISLSGHPLSGMEFWILMGVLLVYGAAQRESGYSHSKILRLEFGAENADTLHVMGKLVDDMKAMTEKIPQMPKRSTWTSMN